MLVNGLDTAKLKEQDTVNSIIDIYYDTTVDAEIRSTIFKHLKSTDSEWSAAIEESTGVLIRYRLKGIKDLGDCIRRGLTSRPLANIVNISGLKLEKSASENMAFRKQVSNYADQRLVTLEEAATMMNNAARRVGIKQIDDQHERALEAHETELEYLAALTIMVQVEENSGKLHEYLLLKTKSKSDQMRYLACLYSTMLSEKQVFDENKRSEVTKLIPAMVMDRCMPVVESAINHIDSVEMKITEPKVRARLKAISADSSYSLKMREKAKVILERK